VNCNRIAHCTLHTPHTTHHNPQSSIHNPYGRHLRRNRGADTDRQGHQYQYQAHYADDGLLICFHYASGSFRVSGIRFGVRTSSSWYLNWIGMAGNTPSGSSDLLNGLGNRLIFLFAGASAQSTAINQSANWFWPAGVLGHQRIIINTESV